MTASHLRETGTVAGGSPCPTCGKRRWLTKADAKKVARRMRGRQGGHLNAYRCGDFWHLGNLPDSVIHGHIGRDQLAPKEIR